MQVAEKVERDEDDAAEGDGQDGGAVADEIDGGDEGGAAAEEIAGVPEEEGEGDEAGGLEEPSGLLLLLLLRRGRCRLVGVDAEDFGGEDGHCGEGEGETGDDCEGWGS